MIIRTPPKLTNRNYVDRYLETELWSWLKELYNALEQTNNTTAITTNVSGGGAYTWQIVTSTVPVNPIQIVANNVYICNGAFLVTFILPLAPAIGDGFKIISNLSRFQINQNGGQQISIGSASSTIGAGNATSNSKGDEIELNYLGANLFRGTSQGTITLN